jgi:hypothetical protein
MQPGDFTSGEGALKSFQVKPYSPERPKTNNYVGFQEDIDEEFDREDDSYQSRQELELLRNVRKSMDAQSAQIPGRKTNLLGRARPQNEVQNSFDQLKDLKKAWRANTKNLR